MSTGQVIKAASLDTPLYYLENLDTVVDWVNQHHRHLLHESEWQQLDDYCSLNTDARALLTRLIMRRGEWFRSDKISYPEINNIAQAYHDCQQARLINYPAVCSASDWSSLCLKQELLDTLKQWGIDNTQSNKTEIQRTLIAHFDDKSGTSQQWLARATFDVIQLTCNSLFNLIKVLFFGNAHQDWSEFVLTELGHQRYEDVAFDTSVAAFQKRSDVDVFITMSTLSDALFNNVLPAEAVFDQLPPEPETSWLSYRWHKLVFRCGHAIERQGNIDHALKIYRRCRYPEASVRLLRVLEKTARPQLSYRFARFLSNHPRPDIATAAQKVQQRSAKKLHLPFTKPPVLVHNSQRIVIAKHASVERACQEYFSDTDHQCFYVENALLPTLFAVCMWPALYAPLPGAFFNPFQRGPADLFQPDFLQRRIELIEQNLRLLDQKDYRHVLTTRFEAHAGKACPLAIWPVISDELWALALDIIPADHLKVIFSRMLIDLRHHCNGLPDLIRFDLINRRYELIEVKGPGDKLQDHQVRWLDFFSAHGIDASVCYVEWQS